jgi:hypothetical protein
VFERFGAVCQQYQGLYWSHFQAALDWDDAEMWLEGALHNDWSVSQMRRTRWDTLAAVQDQPPPADDPVDMDEDFQPPADAIPPSATADANDAPPAASARKPAGKSTAAPPAESGAPALEPPMSTQLEPPTIAWVRPFEHLPELPPDVNEAFDAYKLAIVRHKAAQWQEISLDDMLGSLDALKELAVAPA